jgi:MFS family permease
VNSIGLKIRMTWRFAVGLFFALLGLSLLWSAIADLFDARFYEEASESLAITALFFIVWGLIIWGCAYAARIALRRARADRARLADPFAEEREPEEKAHGLVIAAQVVAGLSVGLTFIAGLSVGTGGMSGVPMWAGLMLAGVLYGVGKALSKRNE